MTDRSVEVQARGLTDEQWEHLQSGQPLSPALANLTGDECHALLAYVGGLADKPAIVAAARRAHNPDWWGHKRPAVYTFTVMNMGVSHRAPRGYERTPLGRAVLRHLEADRG